MEAQVIVEAELADGGGPDPWMPVGGLIPVNEHFEVDVEVLVNASGAAKPLPVRGRKPHDGRILSFSVPV